MRSATPTRSSFGDYHVAKDVGWALTGEQIDDESWPSCSSPGVRTAAGSQALVGAGRAAPAAARAADGAADAPADAPLRRLISVTPGHK